MSYEKDRELNSILARIDSSFLSPVALAKPSNAAFSIGTACDLRCVFCIRQHMLPVDSGFMNLQDFARRAPELIGMQRASLFGLGDPLLNKQFLEFVRVCHAYGIETVATTHAMHLTRELAEEIIAEGVEEIGISLDAAEQPLLNQLRENSDLERIQQNVAYLAQRRRERNAPLPAIIVTCTTSRLNMHQMPLLAQWAVDVGADGICFSDMIAVQEGFVQHTLGNCEEFGEYYQQAQAVAEKHGLAIAHFKQKAEPWRYEVLRTEGMPHGCSVPWEGLFVERRGETRPCCYMDPDHDNFFEQDIERSFHSERKLNLRSGLIRSQIPLECRGCYNLIPNSRPRAESCLQQAEDMLNRSTLLEDADRQRIKDLLRDYRQKLDDMFPMAQAQIIPLPKRLARHAVPQPLRYAVRKLIQRFY